MKPALPLLDLGDDFFVPVQGGTFTAPVLRYKNQTEAKFLGLDTLNDWEWVEHFGRFKPLPNNLPSPLAMKYHGHQFQQYNPDLGDGRGFSFAQFLKGNHLFELGTKGSGLTPYSRRGDGRLTLKGAVRELLATDYLTKQKVLTSKTFSIVETAEPLIRHDEPSPTRSSVLFRLSRGHIRIGHFQRAHFHQKPENILKLVDYSMKYFYPELTTPESNKEKLELFFNSVSLRLADQCASYMTAGFVHGVLNTDNMNISGESFDYGPYRFLPYYNPYFTAAYFDHEGLYSFGRQPPSFLWNLDQLKKTLVFAQPDCDFAHVADDFALAFNVFFTARFARKLNLIPKSGANEASLVKSFLELSPDYYTESEMPILQMNRIHQTPFKEISQSVFFANLQKVIESFFQDLHQDQTKLFEHAFWEVLNWQKNRIEPVCFTKSTLTLFTTHCEPARELTDDHLRLRNQNLVIDKIESIWNEIDQNDNWNTLYQSLSSTTS